MEVLSNNFMEDVTLQRNLISSEMVNSDTVMSAKQGKKKKNIKKRKRGKNSNALANVDPMEVGTLQKNAIGSEMVHSDTVMSAKQGKKKERKKGKNSKALANVDPMEDVTLQRNSIGSEMVHSDTVMSAKQGKKKKKKRKSGKNSNALANVDLIQQPIDGTCLVTDSRLEKRDVEVEDCVNLQNTSFGNSSLSNDSNISGRDSGLIVHTRSTLEVNVNQVHEANVNPISMVVEHNDQVCAKNGSKESSLDAPLAKKKRKKGRKNLNVLSSNYVQFNGLNAPSINNSSRDNESIQLATTSTALNVDSNVMLHGAELGFPVESLKEMHQSTRGSNGEINWVKGRPLAVDLKSTRETDRNSFSKVVKGDNQACTGTISISQELNVGAMRTKRKKKKGRTKNQISQTSNDELHDNLKSLSLASENPRYNHSIQHPLIDTCLMTGPKEVQHDAELWPLDDNDKRNNDKHMKVDAKVDEISVSQEKAVGNMQGGKKKKRKIRGKNLNLKPEEGVICCNDLLEAQQVRRAKMNADQNMGLGKMLTACVQKKLLILDLNGLLADIVGDKTVTIKADGHVAGKKIFKRPFCEDFLQFCFNRFTVGVWSSRKKQNVDKVLQVLMCGKDRSKLAFEWNQSHCTRTGFQTIENVDKPLFLKELSKLWKNNNREFPWKVGDYDKSNTLLLDDSPYKALQNPPYTAIFPTPYQYQDQNDNALGPGGDLRVYLEGLALAEDVQKYVEQNPFGQKPITESDPSWSFYAKVICSRSMKQRNQYQTKSNPSLENRVAPVPL